MRILAAIVVSLAAMGIAPASAAPFTMAPFGIAGGDTRVALDRGLVDTLDGIGVSIELVGSGSSAVNGNPNFGVTGGFLNLNSFTGSIEHAGSGIRLFNSSSSTEIIATDFVIGLNSATDGVLSGTVGGNSVDLFRFDRSTLGADLDATLAALTNLDAPSLALMITDDLSAALDATFATGGVAGAIFGLAATAPAPVPLPAAAWVFLAGVGALGARRIRRAKV